jgi:PKD repeat protein
MSVKVMGANGSGTLDVVASGITYAADNGAQAINLSLTGPAGSLTLENAVNYAWGQGALVVAAAGNNGLNTTMYPAGYDNAMGVGSTNASDQRSCFSNFADNYISVAAPGEAIIVADINNTETGYGYYSGTSLSAPHVVGLAGLLLSQDPAPDNNLLRAKIENTAVDLGQSGFDAVFGYGRIDAYRAVMNYQSQGQPPEDLYSTNNTASGYAHARKLVRDGNGDLHVIWHTQEGSNYKIKYAISNDNGDSWVLKQDVLSTEDEAYHPALAMDDQNLYVAIPSRNTPDAKYEILFSWKPLSEDIWSQPVSIMGGGNYDTVRPDIFVDPSNGRLHLVASSLDNAPYVYYQASEDRGITWNSSVTEINPSTGTTGADSSTRYATIHASGNNIYIAARTVNTSFFTYYYLHTVRSTDWGQNWFDKTKISSYLALFTGEYGVSLAGVGDRIYMGYEVGGNIYFRYHDGTTWSPYETLELGDTDNVYKWPTITQAEDGQAWMIFELNGELFMRHYDGSTWVPKESVGAGSYANLKLGTSGDKLEWTATQCNGAPFLVSYDSRTLGANNPPVANDDSASTPENTPVTIDVATNDTDPDNNLDPSSASDTTPPANGTVTNNGDGTFNYTPNLDFNGSDSFSYEICDSGTPNLCDTATVSITVTVANDPPTASFSYSTAYLTTSFTDTSTDSDGTIASWVWDFGDTNSSTVQNPSHSYAAAGTYTVSLTVMDDDGDSDSVNQSVTVTEPPNLPPTASFSYSTAYLTATFTDTSTDSDGTIASWVWDFGDTNSSTVQNPSHSYAAAGTYTVSLTVTDDDGDSDFVSQNVNVSEPPNALPTASFSYSTVDLTATFNDTSTDSDGTIASWAWDFGDTNSSTVQNPSHNYAAAGTYTVSLMVTDNDGDSDSVSQSVTVTEPPILVDALANSEIFVAGSVSGDYSSTHGDDDTSEAINERDSGGKPVNRYSYLEHKWIFNVTPGNVVTLYANAWSSYSNDGDSFMFAYSTDDASYIDMFVIDNNSHSGYVASYTLPTSILGTVYVRVTDSDHSAGHREQNAIYVDHLYIRSETQPGDPPAAPSGLSVEAVSATQINLLWIDNSLDEYGFQIDRSLDSTNWSQIDSVDADITIYIDTTVSPNTTCFFRVRAFNGSGSSDYSDVASTTTPDGLSLEANGYKIKGKHTVDLTWVGGSFSAVDIYRDRSLIAEGKSGSTHTDYMNNKGGASYQYQVCEAGNPMNCSNTVRVDF